MKRVQRRYDDALSEHSWQEMEQLLAAYYRQQGYQVEHCGTGATQSRYDGGIDLKLRKNDEYIVVQCKHWNALQVPHNDVHQLLGIMVNEAATGAILVTSGEFTPYAKESANKLGHVQLIDGVSLRGMLGLSSGPLEKFREAGGVMDAYAEAAFGKPGRRRNRDQASKKAWLVFSVIAVIIFFLLVRALLSATAWTAGESEKDAAVSIKGEATGLSPDRSRYQRDAPAAEMGGDSEPAGRHTEAVIESRAPTDAEIRESQRQADEAIKVIEATTPELQ